MSLYNDLFPSHRVNQKSPLRNWNDKVYSQSSLGVPKDPESTSWRPYSFYSGWKFRVEKIKGLDFGTLQWSRNCLDDVLNLCNTYVLDPVSLVSLCTTSTGTTTRRRRWRHQRYRPRWEDQNSPHFSSKVSTFYFSVGWTPTDPHSDTPSVTMVFNCSVIGRKDPINWRRQGKVLLRLNVLNVLEGFKT